MMTETRFIDLKPEWIRKPKQVIVPREMSDGEIDEFHSNLREVMLYIKYSKDKTKMDEIIEGDPKFQRVERQAAEVINVVTGSKLKW